ncbi:MAG: hypothetical protein KHW86_17415 [Porphyromonadaceae bacterium]|nr:hypothetical protein [Porphyromonadaceae bacterium]
MKFLFLPAAGWDKSTNHVLCEECFASTLFEVHGRFNRGCTRQDFASCCVDWILLTLHQFRDFLTAIVQSRRFSFLERWEGESNPLGVIGFRNNASPSCYPPCAGTSTRPFLITNT